MVVIAVVVVVVVMMVMMHLVSGVQIRFGAHALAQQNIHGQRPHCRCDNLHTFARLGFQHGTQVVCLALGQQRIYFLRG